MVSRKTIETLFASPLRSLTSFPFRAVFRQAEGEGERVVVLLSVSKRHFKHAVDRNRAKRQMREAYRQEKHLLTSTLEERGERLNVAFIWLSDQPVDSRRVRSSMRWIIKQIIAPSS